MEIDKILHTWKGVFHDERQDVQTDRCQWNPGPCPLVWGHVIWSGISQFGVSHRCPLGIAVCLSQRGAAGVAVFAGHL